MGPRHVGLSVVGGALNTLRFGWYFSAIFALTLGGCVQQAVLDNDVRSAQWKARTLSTAADTELAFAALSTEAAQKAASPLAPRPPHFPARAKRVIFLCMEGGPSHVDTFDHKPKLTEDDGKPFDPLLVPAPDLGAKGRIGGVGLHFVRNLMDELEYARLDGINRLRMMKKLKK